MALLQIKCQQSLAKRHSLTTSIVREEVDVRISIEMTYYFTQFNTYVRNSPQIAE